MPSWLAGMLSCLIRFVPEFRKSIHESVVDVKTCCKLNGVWPLQAISESILLILSPITIYMIDFIIDSSFE